MTNQSERMGLSRGMVSCLISFKDTRHKTQDACDTSVQNIICIVSHWIAVYLLLGLADGLKNIKVAIYIA